jgi:hypothetical protein
VAERSRGQHKTLSPPVIHAERGSGPSDSRADRGTERERSRAMSRSDSGQVARHTSHQAADATDPSAKQTTDAKQRTIEHGAEEYFRHEGSPAEGERAGQPFTGGDAEPPKGQSAAQGSDVERV